MHLIRHRIVRPAELERAARTIMTRQGVRLWPLEAQPGHFAGYRYRPAATHDSRSQYYSLIYGGGSGSALLSFCVEGVAQRFEIKQFSLARLLRGSRFIADSVDTERATNASASVARGPILKHSTREGAFVLEVSGSVTGTLVLKPIKLDERRRYLFYRTGS
jgi:hypothetical protein